MELRQLRYFVAVAEERNISRAAKKIFLTQPALSRQIKALEDEIGQPLLDRQPHSIRLTRTGEALHQEARELLQHADRALERVRAVARGPCLRVGYAPSLAVGILSAAIEGFTQKHPTAHVELSDLSTAEIRAALESGTIDVGLTVGPEGGTRGLKWTPVLRAPWQLAMNRGHRLARQPQITPAEIVGEPLLVFRRRDYPEYWEMLIRWLREGRLRPKIVGEYDGVNSLMSAVESSLGVAVVATRGRLVPARVQLKALSPSPKPLFVAAAQRGDRAGDKVLAVFIAELRNAAKALWTEEGTPDLS